MDALSLLKEDHRQVEKLFEDFQKVDADKPVIAAEVCRLLAIHAQIEEDIFYPAVREALADDESDDLLDEAEVEHASAKDLIGQIEELGESDELFEAKVKVLGEYVQHHVREEERELFPKVKDSTLNLETLGTELERQKKALLAEAASVVALPGATAKAAPNARKDAR